MRIERRFTKDRSVAICGDRIPQGAVRDQEPGRLGRVPAGRHRRAGAVQPGGDRHARPEIFPQGRRAGAAEEGRGERRSLLPVALGRRRGGARRAARRERYVSETDARQVFDRLAGTWTYWGWKGGYFASEDDALAFRDELAYMLATQRVAPNSPQWFNTGLHWAYGIDGPGQGHYLRRPVHRQADQVEIGLRASAAACLLHPGRRRRPRQRGRHHGSVGARGAAVQIRLGHRLQLLACCAAKARSCRAAAARPA